MWLIITIVDIFLFALTAIAVVYLLFFAIASMRYQRVETGIIRKKGRFLFIIAANQDNTSIEDTIKSILKQDYEQKDYDIIVVGNSLSPLQAIKLAQYPIKLFRTNFEEYTKSQSQKYAIKNYQGMKIYDLIIFVDPDETIATDFLTEVNKVLQTGCKFFQLHRKPLNTNSDAAMLSCTMSEINNSIFRKGHVACGLSSALSSSGTALDYNWCKEHIDAVNQHDMEKSLEALLLKQNIFVDYIDEIAIYGKPVQNTAQIAKQKKQWMDSKFTILLSNLKQLLPALLHWNISLTDKIFQWIMIPRILLMAIIVTMSLIMPFIYFTMTLKWWALLFIATFAFAVATPDEIVDKNWTRSFKHIPLLLFSSFINAIFQFGILKKIKQRLTRNHK